MVSSELFSTCFPILIAQATDRPLIQRLDPARNAALLMALLGLVLIGVTLVACIMIGGRWVRRLARGRPPHNPSPPSKSDAWRAALAKNLSPGIPTDGEAGETLLSDAPTDETRAD